MNPTSHRVPLSPWRCEMLQHICLCVVLFQADLSLASLLCACLCVRVCVSVVTYSPTDCTCLHLLGQSVCMCESRSECMSVKCVHFHLPKLDCESLYTVHERVYKRVNVCVCDSNLSVVQSQPQSRSSSRRCSLWS